VKQFSDFTFTLGLFLAYSSYFEEIKVGLWDHVAVCVCLC
jgi:hypothetical protein